MYKDGYVVCEGGAGGLLDGAAFKSTVLVV